MSEQLKPCSEPSCQSTDVYVGVLRVDGEKPKECVRCNTCGFMICAGPQGVDSVASWNARYISEIDPLFDPEAEGWEKEGATESVYVWNSPNHQWIFVQYLDVGVTRLQRVKDTAAYSGAHPTTALVHEIIRQNGGGA